MYLIAETIPGNHPDYHPNLERIYSHWVYTSYYLPDEDKSKFDISKFNAVEVTEEVARGMKFANVAKNKIGVKTGSLAHEEVMGNSMESEDAVLSPDQIGQKTYYYLTADDERIVTQVLKTEMKIHLDIHYNKKLDTQEKLRYSTKKTVIESEIERCANSMDCRKLMHTKFGLGLFQAEEVGLSPEPTLDMSVPGRDNF
jgi:hypothetical protein